MELTFESAFSSQYLLGHAAFLVLIVAMVMPSFLMLRLLVIGAAILWIAFATIILGDLMLALWGVVLIVVNIVQLIRSHWDSFRATFTPAEAAFIAQHLPGLTNGEARALIDAGQWVKFPATHRLSAEGEPVEYLFYIADGHAEVDVGGEIVSVCRAGQFVGEMTVSDRLPATATVQIASPTASLWRIEGDVLRHLQASDAVAARELDAAFARNYREKLMRMNRRVSDIPA